MIRVSRLEWCWLVWLLLVFSVCSSVWCLVLLVFSGSSCCCMVVVFSGVGRVVCVMVRVWCLVV